MKRIRLQQHLNFCLCVTVINVCLGFTQSNHNRKKYKQKQPSCQQKITIWHIKTSMKRISATYRLVLHLLVVISDHLSTSSARSHIYITISQKEVMIGRSVLSGEGVPVAWRQTLLSSTITHPIANTNTCCAHTVAVDSCTFTWKDSQDCD